MQMPLSMKIGTCSMIVMVVGILFGFVIFPKLINYGLKKGMSLKKGTDIRDMWAKIPFGIDFRIYLFNTTNPEEVMKGAKPIIKEIGPYFYEEWKEKHNLEDIEEEDSVIYNRKDTFLFKPEKSGPGLTGNEMIVMPNIFLMALAIGVATERPAMLNVIGKALKGIFDDPKSVFTTVKAQDILFNGVIINCDRTEFAPKAVCTAIRKEATTLEFLPNNQYKFSVFGMRNGSIDPVRMKVIRGTKNIMDVGKVIEVDGKTKQEMWAGDFCNEYEGTDGTVFPPFLTEKDSVMSFSPDLCRTFRTEYKYKTTYKGMKTNRYFAYVGDLAHDTNMSCFCDTPQTCPASGLMDLTKCVKAPLVISLPHYLHTDPSVQAGVIGLSPDEEKHGIYLDFEPITGTPLSAMQRIQFNIKLMKIDKLELFRNLPDTYMPLFWVDEGLSLDDDFIGMLDGQLFKPVRIVGVIKWLMVSFGIIGMLGGAGLHHKDAIMGMVTGRGNATSVNITTNKEQGKTMDKLGSSRSVHGPNAVSTVDGGDDKF